MRDPDRHDTISRLLTGKGSNTKGGLTSEQYASFVQTGKGLDDYDQFAQTQKEEKDDEVDDEMGVAVVFDESDEEAEGGGEGGDDTDEDQVVEVAESSSDDEEEDRSKATEIEDSNDEEHVVQGTKEAKKKLHHTHDRILTVHEIDAHFLQRQLSRHYDDADVCAKIANDALGVLDINKGSDVRECENKLLVLLGFDLFDTIKLLLHNRVRIWACVSMKRALGDEEQRHIETILMKESTGEGKRVWDELHSKSKAEDWTRERMRGITDSFQNKKNKGGGSEPLDSIGVKISQGENGDIMDVEEKDQEAIELDLDSLAFRDGSHTMSNKQCKLPDKSWRAMKKGYEEVHVPAVRSVIPADEKLVPIKELPTWTHDAFKGGLMHEIVA